MDSDISKFIRLRHHLLDHLKVPPEFVIASELGEEHDFVERQEGTTRVPTDEENINEEECSVDLSDRRVWNLLRTETALGV